MKWIAVPDEAPGAVRPDEIAVVHCPETFTFAQGSRQRASGCRVCGVMIGGRPARVIGAAALAGDLCQCGRVVSDVFLIHADHLPMDPAALQAAINRGPQCDSRHL